MCLAKLRFTGRLLPGAPRRTLAYSRVGVYKEACLEPSALHFTDHTLHFIPLFSLQTSRTLYIRQSSSTMASDYFICGRLSILFFTPVLLAIASLNSAIARFAVILRDRAISSYTAAAGDILDADFQVLQKHILSNTVVAAVVIAIVAIFGAAIALHPRWLRDHKSSLAISFAISQMVVALFAVVTGGYVAYQVHGFQILFEDFGANDGIPYYSIIYYGSIAQAAYGSLFFLLAISVAVIFFVVDHYQTKKGPVRVDGEEATTGPV